ncbi:hypothetical protein [Celeribacter sp.]|uniref:hypothetical protein n=1 Tax=Celeribacter sp. TaxID=1890673 RepID=UPI003A95B8E3
MLKTLPYAAVLAAFATSTFAADAPVVTGELGEDTYLMAADTHMTLYTFDKDEKGVSNCNDACAGLWPPVIGEAGDGPAERVFADFAQRWHRTGRL